MKHSKQRNLSIAQIRRGWLIWTLIFVPCLIGTLVALEMFGFYRVFPIILTVLVATLLHQRFVKRRSWQSILWGETATGGSCRQSGG